MDAKIVFLGATSVGKTSIICRAVSDEFDSEMPATITLSEDNEFLDEVVVIGYGTVKKNDMTGSRHQG